VALSFQEDDGCRRHRFTAAYGIQALGRLGLHADGANFDTADLGDAFAHELDVGCEFRTLGAHGAVDVGDLPAGCGGESDRPAQEVGTVGMGIARVRGREVVADIAKRCRSEDRIGDGVVEPVGIAVAGMPWAFVVVDAAQRKRASVVDPVYILSAASAVALASRRMR
jgi:hypothetical protein